VQCHKVSYRYFQVKYNPSYMVNQLNQIAYSHVFKKEFDKAVSVLKKSLDICKTYTPSQHYLSAQELEETVEEPQRRSIPGKYMIWTLIELGEIYWTLKNQGEARICYDKALLISSRIHGETDSKRLNIMCKVGEFYYKTGDIDAAKDIFLSVLALNKKLFKDVGKTLLPHPAIANHYLGRIEYDAQNYEKALVLLEESWSQHRLVVGVPDIRTVHVIAVLGKTYFALGRYDKARECIEYAGAFYTTNNMSELVPELVELHKNMITHIPGAEGVMTNTPLPNRNGFFIHHVEKDESQPK